MTRGMYASSTASGSAVSLLHFIVLFVGLVTGYSVHQSTLEPTDPQEPGGEEALAAVPTGCSEEIAQLRSTLLAWEEAFPDSNPLARAPAPEVWTQEEGDRRRAEAAENRRKFEESEAERRRQLRERQEQQARLREKAEASAQAARDRRRERAQAAQAAEDERRSEEAERAAALGPEILSRIELTTPERIVRSSALRIRGEVVNHNDIAISGSVRLYIYERSTLLETSDQSMRVGPGASRSYDVTIRHSGGPSTVLRVEVEWVP